MAPRHKNRARIPVDARGTHLSVTSYEGTGPTMILLHGITSSSAEFDPVIPDLVEICQPVVIDLRGHGQSDKPDSGYHYQNYVDDLDVVVDRLGGDQPLVLGHSLGGIITLYWAAQNPGVARALIIEDSPLRSGESFREAFDGWLALNAMSESQLRTWYADHHPDWNLSTLTNRTTSMLATSRTAITELMTASMANEGIDSAELLPQITEPVLFLHGDLETGSMVHPDDLAALHEQLANVTVRRVATAGHSVHRSHPDLWLGYVRSFIAQMKD